MRVERVLELFSNIFTHPAFTAIVGFLAGHFLAIGRDKRKEFNEAATKFRNAFTETRKIIRESHPGTVKPGQTDFFKAFTETYQIQYDALLQFKDHPNKKDQEKIESAWEQHCWNGYATERQSHGLFLHYQYSSQVEIDNGKPHVKKTLEESFKEAKQLAMSNIELLLSFASPK